VRVVIDTSVLVSGLRSKTGASFAVLSLLEMGVFEPAVTQALVCEYEAVLRRPHLLPNLTPADVDAFLNSFLLRCKERRVHFLWRPFLPDFADDLVLEAALAGQATLIVTHNVRHFAGVASMGIRAVTPGEFLRILAVS
jgi:predicted nucleic acid-binding protein